MNKSRVNFSMRDFVTESNRIEGILRAPSEAEIDISWAFIKLPFVKVADLIEFVNVIQPGAVLRNKVGRNVMIGDHVPIPGGIEVEIQLTCLLRDIHYSLAANILNPYQHHVRYETLHPFMDGNGRSGRILWLWEMGGIKKAPLGFLHTFYYQTLEWNQQL